MSLALSSRWFPAGAGPETLIAGLKAVGLPGLVLDDPGARAARWREPLRAGGVRIEGLRLAGVEALGGVGADLVAALRPDSVVVPGGPLKAPQGGVWGGAPTAQDRAVQRQRMGARQVDDLARALHGSLAAGWPLAVTHGASADDLLLLEETNWLLGALPRLGLWLDPARLLGLERLGLSAGPAAWADSVAGRVVGVWVHGLGSDGLGHAHPEDDGPAWGRLGSSLPRSVPWALDLSGRLSVSDVREAVRYLEAAWAAPGERT